MLVIKYSFTNEIITEQPGPLHSISLHSQLKIWTIVDAVGPETCITCCKRKIKKQKKLGLEHLQSFTNTPASHSFIGGYRQLYVPSNLMCISTKK